MQEFCDFEQLVREGATREFYGLYQREQLIHLPGTDLKSVRVFLDTFPITEGHVLAIPNFTYKAFRDYPDQTCLIEDILSIIKVQSALYPWSDIVVFEHGDGVINGQEIAACGEVCSVHHAHIHIMPCVSPIKPEMAVIRDFDYYIKEAAELLKLNGWQSPLKAIQFTQADSLFSSRSTNGNFPYLWFGLWKKGEIYQEGTFWQQSTSEKIPSQLFRQILAFSLYDRPINPNQWNYKEIIWRIFVDGFMSELPMLTALISGYHDRVENFRANTQ